MARTGRPHKKREEQPILTIHAEIRVYADEAEIAAYFAQYKPGQYAAAIKRAVRVAMTGGGLNIGGQTVLPGEADEEDEDIASFFSGFVS